VLVVICLVSTAARVAWLPAPCRTPCGGGTRHVLIFDEVYYVNAARAIAGIQPPAGANYADSPLGVDPNAEHPQLAKLIMAGSIEALGDDPWGWRLPSVLVGTVALLGMFALVRAAGGGPWLAVGASALMATDNLLLVHSRIGTLDVYALAAMLWAVVAYLKGRPLLAGAVIGVGLCAKEVAAEALLVVALLEVLRVPGLPGEAGLRLRRLALCLVACAGVLVGLLAAMDAVAAPYDDTAHRLIGGGVFAHLSHILSYAGALTSPSGPHGIASYPPGWLVDYKPIPYLVVVPDQPSPGLYNVHPAVHFLGLINPPLLLAALPGLALAFREVRRGRLLWVAGRAVDAAPRDPGVTGLVVAWFAGTFGPFLVASLAFKRTSYLYYMVIVMPALYLAAAWLAGRWWRHRRTVRGWMVLVGLGGLIAYPLFPLPL
jgi:predicted membrane-bound dolichyl-phosphate-mannose-protein mannosyltransferase